MKRIKIDEDIVSRFKKLGYQMAALREQLGIAKEKTHALWKELERQYPGMNFEQAIINHNTNELVITMESTEKEMEE